MRLRRPVPLLSSFNGHPHQNNCVRRLSRRDGSNAALSDNAGRRSTCSPETQGLGLNAAGKVSASFRHRERCWDQGVLLFPSRLGGQTRFNRWFCASKSPAGSPADAMKSIASSVVEKHRSACSHGKVVSQGQRATLVGLQRDFLCQHDVACSEMTSRRKAPTNARTACSVDLVDVHRDAVANPVSLTAVAACDLKIAFRVILRELLGRQPFLQQPDAARFPIPVSAAEARRNISRGRINAQNARRAPVTRHEESDALLRVEQ